jgi:phosphoglycolate phosphatase
VRKKVIFYDLDGTLVDTALDIAKAVNHVLISLKAKPLGISKIKKYVGHGLNDLLKKCLDTQDEQIIKKAASLFADYYSSHLTDHSVLYPNVKDTLEYFRNRKQAVFTNKPNPFSSDLIKRLGVEGYFFDVIACGTEYPKKPDPKAAIVALESQGFGPSDALLVGDSLVDMETGRNANIETVIVAQGFCDKKELAKANPDIMVDNFSDFLTIARKENW